MGCPGGCGGTRLIPLNAILEKGANFGKHECVACHDMFPEGELVEGPRGYACPHCIERDGSLAPAA